MDGICDLGKRIRHVGCHEMSERRAQSGGHFVFDLFLDKVRKQVEKVAHHPTAFEVEVGDIDLGGASHCCRT